MKNRSSLREERPPKESIYDHFKWRQSPEESLSDWTIEVVVLTTSSSQPHEKQEQQEVSAFYHVHKHVLAVGPRKSLYFCRLFQDSGRFAESQNATSRVELNELAAKCFPQLLDYLYYPNTRLEESSALILNTQTATGLHFLADDFEIPRLSWEASQFWKKDINNETCSTYYEHALILQNHKILQATIHYCIENVMVQRPASHLIQVAEPEFWLALLQENSVTTGATMSDLSRYSVTTGAAMSDFSRHVSSLVVESCCGFKQASWTRNMFQMVTNERYLPCIHPDSALRLLDLERQWVGEQEQEGLSLSSLQKRCIDALATSTPSNVNDGVEDGTDDATIQLLSKQSPLVLAKLFIVSRFIQNLETEKIVQERDQAIAAYSVRRGQLSTLEKALKKQQDQIDREIKVAVDVERVVMNAEKDVEKEAAIEAERAVAAVERSRVHKLSFLCITPAILISVSPLMSRMPPRLAGKLATASIAAWLLASICVPAHFFDRPTTSKSKEHQ